MRRLNDKLYWKANEEQRGWWVAFWLWPGSIPYAHQKSEWETLTDKLFQYQIPTFEIDGFENPAVAASAAIVKFPTTQLYYRSSLIGSFEGVYSYQSLFERIKLIMEAGRGKKK